VVQLVLAGASYREAAAAVGLGSPSSVHRIMQTALAGGGRREVLASESGAMFLERSEGLIRANWAAAMDGDYHASLAVLRELDQQARVLGVYERAEVLWPRRNVPAEC
jgi:transposase-like protein